MSGRILGIGSALYDLQLQVPEFPGEDTKMKAAASLSRGGGPCATGIVAAAVLGAETAYIGQCGDDAFGDFIRKDFERFGVDIGHFKVRPGAVSAHSAVILNPAAASRTCVWFPGTMPAMEEGDVPEPALRWASVVHMDGHHLPAAIPAAKKCRALGIPVSLDAGATYPGIEGLLPYVDILIPSEEFTHKLTGLSDTEAAARQIEEAYHPSVLLVTQGVKGGFWCRGGEITRYPAYPVQAVDTNGCGDVFHGAFLVGRLMGYDILKSAKFASAVSALKASAPGGRDAIPNLETTLAFLRSRGETEF